jgi:hypothetical protein
MQRRVPPFWILDAAVVEGWAATLVVVIGAVVVVTVGTLTGAVVVEVVVLELQADTRKARMSKTARMIPNLFIYILLMLFLG